MQNGHCNYNFSYIYYTDWQIAVCDLGHSSPGWFCPGPETRGELTPILERYTSKRHTLYVK